MKHTLYLLFTYTLSSKIPFIEYQKRRYNENIYSKRFFNGL